MESNALSSQLRETLSQFGDGEPQTTTDVADRLDLGRRATYDRLDRLVERGRLETKKVGANARVWWRPRSDGAGDDTPARATVGWEQQFRSLVDATEEYAIFMLDTEGRVRTWNPGAERIKGYAAADIVGEHFSTFYTEADREAGVPAANLAAAAEHGSTEDEGWRLRADGSQFWAHVTITAIHDREGDHVGYAKVSRDMSDRREYERRLRRQRDDLKVELDEMFQRIDDAFFALDAEWRFTYVNERAGDVLDQSPDDLVGSSVWTAFPESADSRFQREYERAMDTQESVSFEAVYQPLGKWFEVTAYPSESGLSVYFKDVTDRKERERRLERYERIVEAVDDGIYVVDSRGRFVLVNGAYASMTDQTRAELLGAHVSDVVDDDAVLREAGRLEAELEAGERERASLEAELTDDDGNTRIGEATFSLLEGDDDADRIGVVRDITERKERERRLERYERIVEVVPDGVYALDGDHCFVLVNESFCELTGYDRDELLGAHAETVFGDDFVEVANEKQAELEAGDLDIAVLEEDLYTSEGSTLVVESRFGLFEFDDGVTGRAGVVRDVTDRVERERELERQREQLVALNSINDVVREITEAVINQSTREEIEATVCERLAAAPSYQFAYVCEVDLPGESLVKRAEAGVDGYFDDIPLSVDPDDPAGRGPIGQAVRTGETRIANAFADSEFEPWREYAREYGYESSAAIPIVHDDSLYGVIGVYADRPAGFDGEERRVIDQLGEVVGHAIAAAERKRALMSDEVVELDFRIHDVFAALSLPEETEGRVALQHAVPTGDDEFTVFGTATDATDLLATLTEALPHWDEFALRSDGDRTDVEVRMTDPPVLSTVASLGGSVEHAVIADGDYEMRIHLAPTVEVRRLIAAIEDSYPSAELVRRQQISRSREADSAMRTLTASLTDRQRATVEAAYHAGFFEWPRDASGEEMADSLGVAAPTFHQHLRKAERKVFEALFEGATEASPVRSSD